MEMMGFAGGGRAEGWPPRRAWPKTNPPRRSGVQPESLGERRGRGDDRHDAQSGFDCSKLIHQLLLRKNSGTGARVNADTGDRSWTGSAFHGMAPSSPSAADNRRYRPSLRSAYRP